MSEVNNISKIQARHASSPSIAYCESINSAVICQIQLSQRVETHKPSSYRLVKLMSTKPSIKAQQFCQRESSCEAEPHVGPVSPNRLRAPSQQRHVHSFTAAPRIVFAREQPLTASIAWSGLRLCNFTFDRWRFAPELVRFRTHLNAVKHNYSSL